MFAKNVEEEDPLSSLVEISGVRKTYRLGETRVDALKGIDLAIRAGEFTALVGASGSGKSTLLNLIGCIDDADSGTLRIEGREVAGLSDSQKAKLRNQKIGFVFQSFNLIPVLDLIENIELPLTLRGELTRSQCRARAIKAADSVGLVQFAHHRPDQLSGGQRQRVAIARALVTHPALILADEPTANLDSVTAERIVDLMLELNREKQVTFLFSTHDEKLMAKVSRIVRIRDGVITP